jgi:hypothetical protein
MGEIGSDAVVVDSVIGADGSVPQAAVIEHARVPAPPYE